MASERGLGVGSELERWAGSSDQYAFEIFLMELLNSVSTHFLLLVFVTDRGGRSSPLIFLFLGVEVLVLALIALTEYSRMAGQDTIRLAGRGVRIDTVRTDQALLG